MGLGVPFNIASYALLTRLLAQVSGLQVRCASCITMYVVFARSQHSTSLITDTQAGEFVHVLGDAHVYRNHVDALLQQLERQPRPFPRLRINSEITRIDDFRFEHLTLDGYDPWGSLKMEMAV